MNRCRSCGSPSGDNNPIPDHCSDCPPWTCDQCGEPCSMAKPCKCWISLDKLSLADIKALFAKSDLSLEPPS